MNDSKTGRMKIPSLEVNLRIEHVFFRKYTIKECNPHLRIPYLMVLRVLIADGAGHAVVRNPHHSHVGVVKRNVCQLGSVTREPESVVCAKDFLWNSIFLKI